MQVSFPIAASQEVPAVPSGRGLGRSVLLVEDSKVLANLVASALQREGYAVTLARSRGEALEAVARGGIQAALLDLTLPDAPSGEVVREMVKAGIPSIVFTSSFDPETRERILAEGIFDYLAKDHVNAISMVLASLERLFVNEKVAILIVDDSAVARGMLRVQLERFRFKVYEADCGTSALESLREHPEVKLVITDNEMPGMDGYQLVAHLRENHPREELAIIGMSGSSTPSLSAKFLKMGANDFLIKPYFLEELYNRIVVGLEFIEQVACLRSQATHLASLVAEKNRFLGIAAHDLRNPLSAVRGFSELMLEDPAFPDNADLREMLELIQQTSSQMLTLVNDLLDVAAIQRGRLDLHTASCLLHDLIASRIRIVSLAAARKQIRISPSLEPLPPLPLDAARISQVVDNLLGNAVKFSPQGSCIRVSLTMSGERNALAALLTVSDEGPGLSEEDQGKLFGEFQKLSARPTGGEGSTGLGLSIVKRIVDSHGGQIWVESAPGAGASFRVRLPLAAGSAG